MNKKMLLVIACLAVVSLLTGVILGANVKRMNRTDKTDAAGTKAKPEQTATETEVSQSSVHKNDEDAQQTIESSDETFAGTASLSDGGSSDASVSQTMSGIDSAAGPDEDVNLQTEPAPAEYVSKDSANYTYEQMMEDLEEKIEEYKAFQSEIRKLEAYYTSPQWKADYAADEAGQYPDQLKRGVLSEDGIWNLLERNNELVGKIGV